MDYDTNVPTRALLPVVLPTPSRPTLLPVPRLFFRLKDERLRARRHVLLRGLHSTPTLIPVPVPGDVPVIPVPVVSTVTAQ